MLERLTEHCWVLPGDNSRVRPWLGAIVTPAGTVVVDPGNGPVHARELQAALVAIDAAPVRALLVTHHHWDHHFGACAFPDGISIVAQVGAQVHMRRMVEEPWSGRYLAELSATRPGYAHIARAILAAVPDFGAFRALPATETFGGEWCTTLGSVEVRFFNVGGPHEPDSSIVHVQPDNVLFLGDAPYGRGPQASWDHTAILAMQRRLYDLDAAWYVEGHRAPQRQADFGRRIERLAARLGLSSR